MSEEIEDDRQYFDRDRDGSIDIRVRDVIK